MKMITLVKLTITILAAIGGLCMGEVWQNMSVFKMYKLTRISKHIESDLIIDTRQGLSVQSCALHCNTFGSVSFYYTENNTTCFCNSDTDENADENEDESAGTIYGTREAAITTWSQESSNQVYKRVHKQPEAIDCLALFQQGYSEDGVYVIKPVGGTDIEAWCDMANGGWTVIQRRQDGSEDFYRDWQSYAEGFGNKIGEYWIGNDNIHRLTSTNSSLYVQFETFGDVSPASGYAEYSTFGVSDDGDKYRLRVAGYKGGCGDAFTFHNNHQFSTFDNDNDAKATGSCAEDLRGAWWYTFCMPSCLNGEYFEGGTSPAEARGIIWLHCWGFNYSLKRVVMKIRRNE